jgi:hypothetical protein
MANFLRRLSKIPLFPVALFLIVEEWLWEHLRSFIHRIVDLIPLKRIKDFLANWIRNLSPVASLLLFVAPVLILIPLKAFGWWLLSKGMFVSSLLNLVVVKLFTFAIASFIFEHTKPKLMTMNWFRVCYDVIIKWLRWAHGIVDPFRKRIREYARRFLAWFFRKG